MNQNRSENQFDLVDILSIIAKWKKIIIINSIVIVLIAVLVVLIVDKKYTAYTSIMPPDNDSSLGLMSLMSGSPLAALSFLGGATSSDLYIDVLRSEKVVSKLVDEFDLLHVFEKDEMAESNPLRASFETKEKLREITEISISVQTGVIKIGVETKDRQLSADITNAYVRELDHFLRENRVNKGRINREFLEIRLKQAEDDLARVELEFKNFQQEHNLIAFEQELEPMIEAAATLKAELIASQIKVEVLKSYANPNSAEIEVLVKQINELKSEISKMEFGSDTREPGDFGVAFRDIPEVGLQYARLIRDIKIQNEIYAFLLKEYEQAKLQEMRDTPILQLIDTAAPPEIRSFPKRGLIVAICGALSLFIGVGLAFLFEFIENVKTGKQQHSEKWQNIYFHLTHWKNVSNR